MKKHRQLVDELLFDYYLVSSRVEEEVVSPYPYYLTDTIYRRMVQVGQTLDSLVRRVVQDYLLGDSRINLYVEAFPHQKQVLGLKLPILPFFWVRYDAFLRPEEGFFFCEFNYDKPCAQREILFNNLLNPQGNPNQAFADCFVQGIEEYLQLSSIDRPEAVVGIVVDPNHYEELHLAYLYKDLLNQRGYTCWIGGAKNLQVENDHVQLFGQQVNVILRQYPMEHCDEIPCWEQLLTLYQDQKVLILNDPRAILGQGKGLFATLWELLERGNYPLSPDEEEAISKYLPKTYIYVSQLRKELLANKDQWVLKANYSRYSEDVYLGCQHDSSGWAKVIDEIEVSGRVFVAQEFCAIAPMVVTRYNGEQYRETVAYGNFGVYLTRGQWAGISVRWNDHYVTSDNSWFSPVGVIPQVFSINHQLTQLPQRKEVWRNILDEASDQYGYTGGYTGSQEAFSLSSLQLEREMVEEIYVASEQFLQIFDKGLDLVLEQPQVLGPVLGIESPLLELVSRRRTASLGLLGRLDWVLDERGNPKLLEFNAETPAGLVEAVGINDLVGREAQAKGYFWGKDPNKLLPELIKEELIQILGDFSSRRPLTRIGLVATTYYEDWYHTNYLARLMQDIGPHIVVGEVSGLQAQQGQLSLYGQTLDALYRYYPLEWLRESPELVTALGSKTPSINPDHTHILQSKAFLALLWELAERGFFNDQEKSTIHQYLPRTSLSPAGFSGEFVVKPYYQREGQGVAFSKELRGRDIKKLQLEQVVFQERLYLQQVCLKRYTARGAEWVPAYPILGVFTFGQRAAGIYTRAGAAITGKEAIYLPTFIKG